MSARAAITLTLANVVAGVLNYLFQVHAAVALDATAFGLLSAWLAQITLASSIASVVQFLSLDFRAERFDTHLRPVGALSLVAIGVHLAFGRAFGTFALGVVTVVSGILLYAVIGQLQRRLRLADVGAAVLGAAVARVGLSFVTSFYVAQAVAAFAGITVVAAFAFRRRTAASTSTPPPRAALGTRLARSVLLAFATVLFPQLDVLVLSWREDATTLGTFSRLALAARIVFFAGAAVLPVLHSHQLRAAEDGTSPPPFILFAQRWFAPATTACAILLAFVADALVLHVTGDRTTWLHLSCVSAALLVSILVQVQRIAVRAEIVRATACVIGVLVVAAIAAFARSSVTAYVVVACAGNALVLALATVLASRPCRS